MVKGLNSLQRKLKKIPQATKDRLQADISLEGRNVNVDQRSLVPREKDVLISTIGTRNLPKGRIGVEIHAGGAATTVENKTGLAYDYARAMEFGTEDVSPSPFFFFPYRRKKRSIKGKITRRIRNAVKAAL